MYSSKFSDLSSLYFLPTKDAIFINCLCLLTLWTKYETCTANATQLIKARRIELLIYRRSALPDGEIGWKASSQIVWRDRELAWEGENAPNAGTFKFMKAPQNAISIWVHNDSYIIKGNGQCMPVVLKYCSYINKRFMCIYQISNSHTTGYLYVFNFSCCCVPSELDNAVFLFRYFN